MKLLIFFIYYINIVLNKVPTYSPEIPYEFREKYALLL